MARAHATFPDLNQEEATKIQPAVHETYGKVIYFQKPEDKYPIGEPYVVIVQQMPEHMSNIKLNIMCCYWYYSGMYSIPMEVFMHVRFADVDENFIKTEVQSGFYTNETELVRDAVRRMREEKERARHFQGAVAKGIQAIDRGETIVLTPNLLHEIKQDAIRKAKNGEPYKSMC